MLKFRIKIIKCVLSATKTTMVEKAILHVINQKIESGISEKRIILTLPSLEQDMLYQLKLKHTKKKLNNINEALKIFKEGINLN